VEKSQRVAALRRIQRLVAANEFVVPHAAVSQGDVIYFRFNV